jgi:hypothetical protein
MKRIIFLLAALSCSIPATAQEPGQVGLSIGFPGSIGVVWHASDSLAIRPDFSFNHTSSESGSPASLNTSSWSYGFGVSALFYVGKVHDNVRAYLAPRFGYVRTNADTEPTSYTVSSGSHSNSYVYTGSAGVQYSPVRRFSVYGEAGIQYSDSASTFEANTTVPDVIARGKSTSSSFGTRAGVGIVWYFK